MLIKIDKDELSKGMQTALRGLGNQSTLPVLSGVLLRADSDKEIWLQTTNLDIAVRTMIPATVEEKGSIVVPAQLLSDILKAAPEGAVTLKHDGVSGELKLSIGRGKFSIKTLAVEDFPEFPSVDEKVKLVLPVTTFVEALTQVLRSVSREETRPVLNGVLFSYADGNLELVSTDSYRLTRRILKIVKGPKTTVKQVVPYRVLEEIAKLSKGKDITIALGEYQARFETTDVNITSRLIEGTFPEYERLLPDSQKYKINVDRGALQGAITRAAIMAEKNHAIHLHVGAHAITIRSEQAGVGTSEEDVPIAIETDADMTVAFNSRYCLDGIASIGGNEVVIGMESSTNPAVFYNLKQEDFLYLIMPLRL